MNLEDLLSRVLEFTTTLDPRTAGLLFLLCAIGEFGIAVPYVLEGVWLLAGYHFGARVLSPLHLLGFWLAAQAGRQTGALLLYHVTKLSTLPLVKFYRRRSGKGWLFRFATNTHVLRHVNLSSPFSVALGRLVGLRLPISLTLALKRNWKTLAGGVLLSSLIWDSLYIFLGATVGATAVLKPVHMFLASLAALTLVYVVTLILRRVFKRRQAAEGEEEDVLSQE